MKLPDKMNDQLEKWAELSAGVIETLLTEIDELSVVLSDSNEAPDEAIIYHARLLLEAYYDMKAGRHWSQNNL